MNFQAGEHYLYFHFEQARCRCGHTFPLFTTDAAHCSCGGFAVWAKSIAELRWLHEQHLRHVKEKTQCTPPATLSGACAKPSPGDPFPNLHQVREGLHELRWNDAAGYCVGCSWRLSGLSRATIETAYQAHLRNPSGYKTY